VKRERDRFIIRKNHVQALWALVIVAFMVPVSALLFVVGLRIGRPEVAWALVIFGVFATLAMLASAVALVRTLLAPWRMVLERGGFKLYAPSFDLDVPWEQVASIGVDKVLNRPGCVLLFSDAEVVAERAIFYPERARRDAVANAPEFLARMGESYENMGFHLGLPRRLLELGPEELAEVLTQACTGALWQEGRTRS
jgi:hypothetical protein